MTTLWTGLVLLLLVGGGGQAQPSSLVRLEQAILAGPDAETGWIRPESGRLAGSLEPLKGHASRLGFAVVYYGRALTEEEVCSLTICGRHTILVDSRWSPDAQVEMILHAIATELAPQRIVSRRGQDLFADAVVVEWCLARGVDRLATYGQHLGYAKREVVILRDFAEEIHWTVGVLTSSRGRP